MKVIKRLNQRLNIYDYTTPGIACRIMDTNILTFKKLLNGGHIPFRRATTAAGEALIRIKDIITYSIRQNLPLDMSMLNHDSFKQVSGLIESVYMYAFEPNTFVATPLLIPVNLKALIQLIEIDPFQPICIGDMYGGNFPEYIANELNDSFPQFSASGMSYKLTMWKKGKAADSKYYCKHFHRICEIVSTVELLNTLWKEQRYANAQ